MVERVVTAIDAAVKEQVAKVLKNKVRPIGYGYTAALFCFLPFRGTGTVRDYLYVFTND